MPSVEQRGTVWFYLFFAAMIVGGLCIIGYWQSYSLQCGGFGKTWVWALPPHFECKLYP